MICKLHFAIWWEKFANIVCATRIFQNNFEFKSFNKAKKPLVQDEKQIYKKT